MRLSSQKPYFLTLKIIKCFHNVILVMILSFSGSYIFLTDLIKKCASSQWSFCPNSALGSIETVTIRKTHSTLLCCTEQALHKFYRSVKFSLAIFLNVILKLSLSLVEKMMFKFDQFNNLISLT